MCSSGMVTRETSLLHGASRPYNLHSMDESASEDLSPVAARGWDALQYERRASFVWKLAPDLVRLLDAKPGERVLDVGCGPGHLSTKIAEAGAEVLAIDASPSMIEQARKNYPQLHFEVLDATQMDFGPQFDAVFSNASLHWITEPANAASRVYRALISGGRFVAEFGGKGNISAIVDAIHRARAEVSAPRIEEFPWYFPSVGEYTSLLESQGFIVTHAHLLQRPTQFEGGEAGMRDWLDLFARPLMVGLTHSQMQEAIDLVEEELRPTMFKEGIWTGDYVRIRVRATRQ